MTLKAAIFDMDGVLCATIEYHYLSWKKVTGDFQLPFTRQDNEKLLGLTRRHSLEVILQGRELPEEQKRRILKLKNEYYLQMIEDMNPADLLPGVDRLLKEIKAAGLPVAVASGSSNTRIVLKRLEIDKLIDIVVDGNHVSRSKPHPDVFLKAAWSLRVSPTNCIVFEDSSAGIRAAIKANMCVVGVGPRSRLKHAHAIYPDLESVSLEELRAVYRRWREGEQVEWHTTQ